MNVSLLFILVGLLVIVVVAFNIMKWRKQHYSKSRTQRTRNQEKVDNHALLRDEPHIDDDAFKALDEAPNSVDELKSEAEQDPLFVAADEQTHPTSSQRPASGNAKARAQIIQIYLMSENDSALTGAVLLQALLSVGLRHGEMSIFHRYESASGHGSIRFSVANAVEPGVFDLDNIDSFATPGLSFFMTLPGPSGTMSTYNLMLDTAKRLAGRLNARLLDEQHQPLTSVQINQHRRLISGYETNTMADNEVTL